MGIKMEYWIIINSKKEEKILNTKIEKSCKDGIF